MWFLGAALFSHVIAYFGITYFDNTQVAWYTLLAIISAATFPILAGQTSPALADAQAFNEPLADAYRPLTSPQRKGLVPQMGPASPRFAPASPSAGPRQGKYASPQIGKRLK
jgi:hypothetical protein